MGKIQSGGLLKSKRERERDTSRGMLLTGNVSKVIWYYFFQVFYRQKVFYKSSVGRSYIDRRPSKDTL